MKLSTVTDPAKRFRQAKDLGDAMRLSEGNLKSAVTLIKHKNPSNVFEVIAQKLGMGKDRLRFGENHMYWDFQANVAYSKGKPYSIIKFNKAKISKFPKALRNLIKKADKGLLSQKAQNSLRMALNRHIKANPGKFFTGPRTSSMPIGESEFVLGTTSKFIKGNLYKTFDNDLQKFVSIIEGGFGPQQKVSLAKKFIAGWKNKPFTKLRLRLTNPDLLKVRKYARLIERDLGFPNANKLTFLGFFKKLFSSKKGQFRFTKPDKIKPGKVSKTVSVVKAEIIRRKIPIMTKRQIAKFSPFKTKRQTTRPISRRMTAPRRVVVRKVTRTRVKPRPRVIRKVRKIARVRLIKRPRKVVRTKVRPRTRVIKRVRVIPRPRVRKLIRPPTRVVARVRPKPKPRKVVQRKKVPKITLMESDARKNKIIRKILSSRTFVYLPDFYSVVFGIKVGSAKEKAALLRVGRIFSGLERRAVINKR